MLVPGLALSLVLFWLYGISLRHGHLSTITLGWVVVVTCADLLVDRFGFGVQLPWPSGQPRSVRWCCSAI